MTGHPVGPAEHKRALRRRLLESRKERSEAARAQAGSALAAAGLALVAERGCATVACYFAVGSEPPTAGLLSGLLAAGVRVLMPVIRPRRRLDWATAGSGWRPGPFGLTEPEGPLLGGQALTGADVAFVPALAVDRAGNRLGRGGGFFDRALHAARPGLVLAVVYADELLDALPCESTDVRVDGALHPGGITLSTAPN